MHTITLYSANGTRVAAFPAFNNVCYHTKNGDRWVPTNGPMTDGVHAVVGRDQFGAIAHRGGPPDGEYGPNGIIHLNDYWGVSGDSKVTGAGLHGGRKGPDSCTAGCLRTTNSAIAFINLYIYTEDDPLTEIDVQRNEATILSWVNNAPPDVADHINWNIVNNDATHDNYWGQYVFAGYGSSGSGGGSEFPGASWIPGADDGGDSSGNDSSGGQPGSNTHTCYNPNGLCQ